MNRRLGAFAVAALLLASTDLAAQACVGGPRLGATNRMLYATGRLDTNDGGNTFGAELGFVGQGRILAGMSIDYSTFLGESEFTSANLNYMFGPALSAKDDKGLCVMFGLGGQNLSNFDAAGRSRVFAGASYGVERAVSFGTIVPFGGLHLNYTEYGGTDDLPLAPSTDFIIELGSGFRLSGGSSLTASLRTAAGENSDVSLRLGGTFPLWRGSGVPK